MGVKFNWGRALSSGGRSLEDYFVQKGAQERQNKLLAENRDYNEQQWIRRNHMANQHAAERDEARFNRSHTNVPFQMGGMPLAENMAVPNATLFNMMNRTPAPAPVVKPKYVGSHVEILDDGSKVLVEDYDDGTMKRAGVDWAGDPVTTTATNKDQFGTPSPGDLKTMIHGAVGSIDDKVKEDNVTPGGYYTPPLAGNTGYDPLDILGQFSSAARDSIGAGRSPKDPKLPGEIYNDVGVGDLDKRTRESIPRYLDIQAEWMDKHGAEFEDDMFKHGGLLGMGKKSTTQSDFVKKGAPGYTAFKEIIAPMIDKETGLGGADIAALAGHAKQKGVDLGELISDIEGLDEGSKSLAIKEVELGVDLIAMDTLPDGRTVVTLADGTEKVVE